MSIPYDPVRLPDSPPPDPQPTETLVVRVSTLYYFGIAIIFFVAGFIIAWVTYSTTGSGASAVELKSLQAEIASLRTSINAVGQSIANGGTGGNAGDPSLAVAGGNNDSAPTVPTGPVDINVTDRPAWGPADAKVTIVEFSDFQCPYCHQYFLATYPLLKATYGDKVRYVFIHTPLTSIHPDAERAALASECAREQEKFWEFHDQTFGNQSNLSREALISYAGLAGVSNIDQFTKCLDTAKYISNVQSGLLEADKVGVTGTPTFFINGVALVGAQPWSVFKSRVDAALNAAGG